MFRAYGIRLPILYFLQSHAFDLIRGTDTHVWLPKSNYDLDGQSFEKGVLYMSSLTSEIRRVFEGLDQRLGPDFDHYHFVDVGCGKGKVPLYWAVLCRQTHHAQKVSGIEYYPPLVKIAQANFQKVMGEAGDLRVADATRFDFSGLGDRLIIYLYNPFVDEIFEGFLNQIKGLKVILIYNNPIEHDLVVGAGFRLLEASSGFHRYLHTSLYANHDLP